MGRAHNHHRCFEIFERKSSFRSARIQTHNRLGTMKLLPHHQPRSRQMRKKKWTHIYIRPQLTVHRMASASVVVCAFAWQIIANLWKIVAVCGPSTPLIPLASLSQLPQCHIQNCRSWSLEMKNCVTEFDAGCKRRIRSALHYARPPLNSDSTKSQAICNLWQSTNQATAAIPK